MTTKTIDSKAETPAERYKRISDLVHATPSNAPAPITYRDALFALDYVANDQSTTPALRKIARRARRKMFSRLQRAEIKGGKV